MTVVDSSNGKKYADNNTDQAPLVNVESARIGYKVGGLFNTAVKDVTFEIQPRERVMLLGPSGCGKSTLLKMIGGFLSLKDGRLHVQDRESPPPGPDRAMVFQEFDQLFPWRTVLGNISYPLRRNGYSKDRASEDALYYLDMMGLKEAQDRYPHQLSGGMKQRVAIARAFSLQPLILLMDEPFGSLDALTRTRLQKELNDISLETGITLLFVTHSIDEAIVLGDRIIVLSSPPSVVKEEITLNDRSKDPTSEDYTVARMHLRRLLNVSGEEDDDDSPFE